jgi:hypothetical protein
MLTYESGAFGLPLDFSCCLSSFLRAFCKREKQTNAVCEPPHPQSKMRKHVASYRFGFRLSLRLFLGRLRRGGVSLLLLSRIALQLSTRTPKSRSNVCSDADSAVAVQTPTATAARLTPQTNTTRQSTHFHEIFVCHATVDFDFVHQHFSSAEHETAQQLAAANRPLRRARALVPTPQVPGPGLSRSDVYCAPTQQSVSPTRAVRPLPSLHVFGCAWQHAGVTYSICSFAGRG